MSEGRGRHQVMSSGLNSLEKPHNKQTKTKIPLTSSGSSKGRFAHLNTSSETEHNTKQQDRNRTYQIEPIPEKSGDRSLTVGERARVPQPKVQTSGLI